MVGPVAAVVPEVLLTAPTLPVAVDVEPVSTFADLDAKHDFLARNLSILLMTHPIWPR